MAADLLTLRNGVLINLNDLQDVLLGTGDRYRTFNLNNTINTVIRHYEKLLNQFYQGYLTDTVVIDLIAGQASYPLGPTFRSPIYEVRRVINTTDFYLNPIHTYNAILSTVPVDTTQFIPSYHLEGNNFVLNSIPQSSEVGAITVKFQKKLAPLVADIDELDDQMEDAEDCIILKSTVRSLKAKDVSGALKNISGFEAELREAEAAFFTQVGNRYVKHDRPIPTDTITDLYF